MGMMRTLTSRCLRALVAVLWLPIVTAWSDPYEVLLKQQGIDPSTEGILGYFAALNRGVHKGAKIEQIISDLGAAEFRVRRSAEETLASIGFLYRENLVAAAKSEDPEISSRARVILEELKSVDLQSILYGCYQLLARDPNPNYATPIFQTLPLCKTTHTFNLAVRLLQECLVPDDEKALRHLLGHDEPKFRAAALALLQDSEAARKALVDEYAEIRICACRVLANLNEPVPHQVLLDLMADEDPDIRSKSVQLLREVTGAQFGFAVYDTEEDRLEALKRWRNALASGSAKLIEPVAVDTPLITDGHTLLAHGYRGGVKEVDPTGQVLWDFSVKGAWSAERLPNGNTLIASYSERRLIEVDRKGEEVWEFKTPNLNARPMPNGNILVAGHSDQRIFELRRKDSEVVWEYDAGENVLDAQWLKNDHILYAWEGGVREIKRNGDVVWQWLAPENGSKYYGVQRLANGNTLIADYGAGRVFELSFEKAIIWEYSVSRPSDAFRLPNGNTLITTSRDHREITPVKETIWTWPGARSGSARR